MKGNETINDELASIRERYQRRAGITPWKRAFYKHSQSEREAVYARILRKRSDRINELTVLEVGAGNGSNLPFFHQLGVPWENIYANELLEDRLQELRERLPGSVAIFAGNALDIPVDRRFDVVLVSTVFTSILDEHFRQSLAHHLLKLVAEGGMILWYDFMYDNPWNKDVRGVSKRELKQLFRDAKEIYLQTITLAPPIGRVLGNRYRLLSWIPFLRSHVVAEILV